MPSPILNLQVGLNSYEIEGEKTDNELAIEDARREAELYRAISDVTNDVGSQETSRAVVAELTRVSAGLEALMTEVDAVVDPAAPTKEELDAIRVAAMAVNTSVLSTEESSAIEQVMNGHLTGSQESIIDVIKSVGVKINYAASNFLAKTKNVFSSAQPSEKMIETAKRLRVKIKNFNTDTFAVTLDGAEQNEIACGAKLDIIKDIHSLPKAVTRWAIAPSEAVKPLFNQLESIVKDTFGSSDEESFKANYEKILQFKIPMDEDAVLRESFSTRRGMIDCYAGEALFGGLSKVYMLARSSGSDSSFSKALDHAGQLANYESVISRIGPANPKQPVSITLTKAELLDVVDVLEETAVLIRDWVKNDGLYTTMQASWRNTYGDLGKLAKQPWMNNSLLNSGYMLAYTYVCLFYFMAPNIYPLVSSMSVLYKFINKTVYGSDLSGS
ncbi:hypothetical protein [Proteus phage 10]|nr:hypothetical protein [Proteus phage 10]